MAVTLGLAARGQSGKRKHLPNAMRGRRYPAAGNADRQYRAVWRRD